VAALRERNSVAVGGTASWGEPTPNIADYEVQRRVINGVACECVVANGDLPPHGVILYFHGGGYLRGEPHEFRGVTVPLAKVTTTRVVVPSYRLAPENPFPAAYEDALAVYVGLVEQDGVSPSEIVVAGDSAGGGIAAALLVGARDGGLPMPACAVLHCPYADLAAASPSLRDPHRETPGLPRSRVDWLRDTYLAAGNPDPYDIRHSPVYADLTGLPPLLIQVAGRDLYHDDGVRLAANGRARGVNVTYSDFPDSEHVWILKATDPDDPAAVRAIAQAAEFIAEHAGVGATDVSAGSRD
jgi:epsilon-lactone hydrolase